MRCFLAIELSEEAKKELIGIQEELSNFFEGKSVESENLHLTLKFFGEIDEKDIVDIRKNLKELKFNQFSANLGKIGFFPNENAIRVVWVSLEPLEQLRQLNVEVNSSLEGLGLRKDDFDFQSHVTLARIKNVKDKAEFLKKVQGIKIKPVSFEVKEFVLKKSMLTEKGQIYEDVEKFELI